MSKMTNKEEEDLEASRDWYIQEAQNKAIDKLGFAASPTETRVILNDFAMSILGNVGLEQSAIGKIGNCINADNKAEAIKGENLSDTETTVLKKAWDLIDLTQKVISEEHGKKTGIKKILDGFVRACKKIVSKLGFKTKIEIPQAILDSLKGIQELRKDARTSARLTEARKDQAKSKSQRNTLR